MSSRIEAYSEKSLLFLYDPAAVPADLPKRTTKKAWEPLVKEGALLAFRTHETDPYSIGVIVDEAVSEELRGRGKSRVQGALLKVPSGNLRYCGAEVCGEREPKSEEGDPRDATVTLPAGEYEIEVLETGYSDDDRERIEAEVVRREGRTNARIDKWLTILKAIILLGGVIPGPIFWYLGGLGIVFADSGWRAGLKFALYGLGVIVACWWVGGLLLKIPLGLRLDELRRELRGNLEELPDFLVVMRRLPPGTNVSGMKGGSFGPVR